MESNNSNDNDNSEDSEKEEEVDEEGDVERRIIPTIIIYFSIGRKGTILLQPKVGMNKDLSFL